MDEFGPWLDYFSVFVILAFGGCVLLGLHTRGYF